jgi:Chloride channel protein EriC
MEEWKLIIIFIIMGIYFAFLGKLFSIMLEKSRIWYNNLDSWKYKKYTHHTAFKIAFLTIITWATGLFFPTMIGGDQTFLISHATTSYSNILILIALIILISLFTIISNASGFPGGIFLPMMTVGGLAGKLFYEIIKQLSGLLNIADTLGMHKLHILTQIGSSAATDYNLSGYFMLIGMSAFFISVVRTPLTGFILISEMTGHYEVFFPTLIVGIMVFFLTQLLKVEPMNDLLYKFMIQSQTDEPPTTTLYVDVSPDSYFYGKTTETLQLPKECTITEIYRGKNVIPFANGVSISAGDQLSIVVQTKDLEKVHQPLVSMGI